MFKYKLMFKIIALLTIQTFIFSTSVSAYPTFGSISKVEKELRVSDAKLNRAEEIEARLGGKAIEYLASGEEIKMGVDWEYVDGKDVIRQIEMPKMEARRQPDGKFIISGGGMMAQRTDLFRNFELLSQIPSYEELKGKIKGKNVLIRVNMNEPDLEKDATRLDMQEKIIRFVLDEGGTPILYGHGGRLDRDKDKKRVLKDNRFSFKTQAEYIQNLFPDEPVVFHKESIRRCNIDKEEGLRIGKYDIVKRAINIIENVRFGQGAETGSFREEFANQIARLSDGIFIFDAFGDIDSKGASVEDVPQSPYIKEVYLGPEMTKEFAAIKSILEEGFEAMVTGGNKLEKLVKLEGAIKQSLNEGGFVLLGSGLSNALDKNPEQLAKFRAIEGKEIISSDYSDEAHNDIGDTALKQFFGKLDTLKPGNKVVVNGTLGLMEGDERYQEGTKKVYGKLDELADRGVKIIVVGGDATKAAKKYGLLKNGGIQSFSGGGVALTLLSGEVLKGIDALAKAMERIALAQEEAPAERITALNNLITTMTTEQLELVGQAAGETDLTQKKRLLKMYKWFTTEITNFKYERADLLRAEKFSPTAPELARVTEEGSDYLKRMGDLRRGVPQVLAAAFSEKDFKVGRNEIKTFSDRSKIFAQSAMVIHSDILRVNQGGIWAIKNLLEQLQDAQVKGLKLVLDFHKSKGEKDVSDFYENIKQASNIDLSGQFDYVVSGDELKSKEPEERAKEVIGLVKTRLPAVDTIEVVGPQEWAETYQALTGSGEIGRCLVIICELEGNKLARTDMAIKLGVRALVDRSLLSNAEGEELEKELCVYRADKTDFYKIASENLEPRVKGYIDSYQELAKFE